MPRWSRPAAQLIASCLFGYLGIAYILADLSIFTWPKSYRSYSLFLALLLFWMLQIADRVSESSE